MSVGKMLLIYSRTWMLKGRGVVFECFQLDFDVC